MSRGVSAVPDAFVCVSVCASYSIRLERLPQEGAGQTNRLGKGSKRGRGLVLQEGEREAATAPAEQRLLP
jgi:hypothetical protein